MVSKFLTCRQGLFEVIRRVGPVDYEVLCPGHKKEKQISHINLLKLWQEKEGLLVNPSSEEEVVKQIGTHQEEPGGCPEVLLGSQLMHRQQGKLRQLVKTFCDVFSEIPGCAKGISHRIIKLERKVVREKWRWIPITGTT